jgi:hypothetical protein
MEGSACYVIKLAREYLPKLTLALLLVSIALILVTAQPSQVAARPPWWNCYNNWYWNYNYNYNCYSYYYWFPYYYNYYSYPYYSYYYSPTSYTLTVATDPANLGTVSGGGSYAPGNSASFSVTQTTVQVSPGTQYVFSHWSGDYSGAGNSGAVTMDGAMSITAVYQLQYYLNVNAQPQSAPVPQGAGWYNAGATATLQSSGETIGGNGGSRLAFQGWSVDGQVTQPSPTLQVTMNSPHNVTALYNQQYYLNVQTDQGTAYGSGWYDAGSTAQIYVSTPVSTTYGVSIVFNGWQGDLQSSSQTASVVVDKPMNVIATWRSDPTVLYLTITGLVLAALLIVGGVLVALSKGRGGMAQAPPTVTQTQTPTSSNAPQSHSRTHARTEHHKRKTEPEQGDTQATNSNNVA